jgi:ABC-type proline/glycine betaine transport system ATPase subunit
MTEPTLTELHQKIDAGVRVAIAEALERHRRLGESISILKDGQIVTLTADQIPLKPSENPSPS